LQYITGNYKARAKGKLFAHFSFFREWKIGYNPISSGGKWVSAEWGLLNFGGSSHSINFTVIEILKIT
jgi:hypothetical protein